MAGATGEIERKKLREMPRYFVKVPGHFLVQNFLGILLCALYLPGFPQAL